MDGLHTAAEVMDAVRTVETVTAVVVVPVMDVALRRRVVAVTRVHVQVRAVIMVLVQHVVIITLVVDSKEKKHETF